MSKPDATSTDRHVAKIAEAEARVLKCAMICWKYDPVSGAIVGYTKRYNRLLTACEALDKLRRTA